ncbi:sugar ABC transporter ATP-binding protein [Paractinoplanes ferrugineus]|uniref:Ribose import ATP-binding protein RbsA n=1 Tax=Paractinoplanes ferrugineus TaxID=113564 RepID=A0A919MB04_9ACTN|nr:sugar ABC transporter ATP-binding protein [Actinoplanes ferrugineus]GIE13141.1 ribose import ATP-binding protein RbsA [Actinoplanes ferrugineus]
MSDRSPVLELNAITKTFPGVNALQDVAMTVFPGEVHTLLGENGAGKSTLLKIMFGVQPADSGEIRIDGEPARFAQPADAMRAGIAMVHQELNLVPQMTAVQNVVLGRERTTAGVIDWAEARRRARESLARLGFDARADVPVRQLSVAHQQMVELARALSVDARIIIMDEPTASLTTQESERLFRIIEGLRTAGKAIIYVSHRLKEVLELSDRITVLRDGRLVASRTRAEVTGEPDLIRLMVGRDLAAIGVPPSAKPAGEEILRVANICRPGVLHDVSLTLRRGEIVGMAGMVGAGRTELARVIFGADRASSGTIHVAGKPAAIRTPGDAIAAGIALLTEDRKHQSLVLGMTTASNATLLKPPTRFGFLDRRRQNTMTEDVLRPLNTKMRAEMVVGKLSGGTQQKVVLGRWLLSDSEIFIFDEPTRGIDVGAKGEIHTLMRDLADQGKAILMISSDLPEVLGMSDRVLVMRRGRIVAELPREDATEEAVVHHAAAE